MAAPSPLAFWARRQAHETAIHRADAESAAGAAPEYEPGFAADGIDELIMGFGRRRKYQPGSAARRRRLRVLAADTGDAWSVEATRGPPAARRDADGAAEAGCTVSGPASGVYLFLWNRAGPARPASPSPATPDCLGLAGQRPRPLGVTGSPRNTMPVSWFARRRKV